MIMCDPKPCLESVSTAMKTSQKMAKEDYHRISLRVGLGRPQAQAQTGLGLGVGPRAWAYLVKAQAWPEPGLSPKFTAQARPKPEVFWPDPVQGRQTRVRIPPGYKVFRSQSSDLTYIILC
jgi:hypothetical protein